MITFALFIVVSEAFICVMIGQEVRNQAEVIKREPQT